MGAESLKAAVVDAGPLIHLSEIGCVQHLRIFKTIHIPNAVWSETFEQAGFWNLNISTLGNIQRHTLPYEQIAQFIRDNGLEKLHMNLSAVKRLRSITPQLLVKSLTVTYKLMYRKPFEA